MQNKLHDYGKLKANLKWLENEQTQNMKTINALKKTNIKLNARINELEQNLSNISNNTTNEISINDLNCLNGSNDNVQKEEIVSKTMTFIMFCNFERLNVAFFRFYFIKRAH